MTDNIPSILIMSGVKGDTRRYRTFHLYEQARLLGIDSQLSHTTDRELHKKIERSSVVFLHRAIYDHQITWLEREIHRKNGFLIQDIDDLLFEPEAYKYINSFDFSDPIRASLYQEEMHLYRRSLLLCDAVTSSTEYLADRARLLGKNVRIHRNAFSLEMLALSVKAYQKRQPADNRIVMGYASGTATHDQDLALIKPALISTLRRFPTVELWLVGPVNAGPDWGGVEHRIRRIDLVPWRDLPGIISRFDVNLAPLRIDNPFSQSKSEIKYMEAALVRVPTVASPTDAFKIAIKSTATGILASNIAEWENALEKLITQPALRHHVGETAFEDVYQRYHPAFRAKELAQILVDLLGQGTSEALIPFSGSIPEPGSLHSYWSSAQVEKTPSLLQRGWYTIRYRGLLVLLKQMWIYFRRLISPLFPFHKTG
jgi:glycosyltransferase involved in cell wall biosynthesis